MFLKTQKIKINYKFIHQLIKKKYLLQPKPIVKIVFQTVICHPPIIYFKWSMWCWRIYKLYNIVIYTLYVTCVVDASHHHRHLLLYIPICTYTNKKKKRNEEKPHKHFLVSLSYYIATSSFSPLSEYRSPWMYRHNI